MTVKVKSLRKEFNVGSGTEVAVDDIDLEIKEGEFVTLVGPSGCGKTTLLRCIAGLETPTSGEITINGRDMVDIPANKRNLSMMFQNIALYPHMDIKDNIAYPLKVKGFNKADRYERAAEAAALMKIPDMVDKYPSELSGGQRQRAALARTVIQDPNGFLMDEPLSDLDAQLKVDIRKEIQRVHKRVKKPTLYVTHDQEEAMTMSDRIAVMNDGDIQQIGTPDELYRYPNSRFVGSFIGNPSMNFINADVIDSSEDHVTIAIQGKQFDMDITKEEGMSLSSTVTIGFRPESIELQNDINENGFQGRISLLERIGDRLLATVISDETEIRATVPVENVLEEDTSVTIALDWDHIHLFDPQSGEAVARTLGFQNLKQDPIKPD